MSVYLSHPVRRIRDDPVADETVSLVVELDDADSETLRSAVEAGGGEVERDLGFESFLVELPQPAVADLCGLSGLARIETANTLSTVGVEDSETPDGDSTED